MRRAVLALFFCAATAVLAPAQAFDNLHVFCTGYHCADGVYPSAALVQGADGNLYGTTPGAQLSPGTIFKITPDGTLTTLANIGSDKALTYATDGNFYGPSGALNCNGFSGIFKITPEGALTTVHCFVPPEGNFPNTLMQASDGNFYGTASYGGNYVAACNTYWPYLGCGTVFKMTPEGVLTTLYSFTDTGDGARPNGPLVQTSDGNFYGTATGDAVGSPSTVFQITPAGKLTTVYSFGNGVFTVAPLVQGTDGNFYGTTVNGGTSDRGTVFKLTPQGQLTTLHSFCHVSGCFDDGSSPYAGLVQSRDGNLYGTTGGSFIDDCFSEAGSCGTVFKVSYTGTFVTVHKFDYTDGAQSVAGLVEASDGTLYGTTYYGGSPNNCGTGSCGTVFSETPQFNLSVNRIGMGTVTSTDGYINCGAVCSWNYKQGTTVSLVATPDPGRVFAGWKGCDQVNGNECDVEMLSAKTVTATFPFFTLTSLTFKPTYVKGGQLSAATLKLSGPAPQEGASIALSSDHPAVAHPPSFVFVPAGQTSVQFAVKTYPVKSNTAVTITATSASSQVSGTLTVGTTSLPPALR